MSGTQVAAPQHSLFAQLRPDDTLPSRLQINPQIEGITSLIAQSCILTGDLEFADGVKIDGQVIGDVTFGTKYGMCIVTRPGVVTGNITGSRILIVGQVNGDLNITDVCFLAPSAVVRGNITAGSIITMPGASIDGTLRTRTVPHEAPFSGMLSKTGEP